MPTSEKLAADFTAGRCDELLVSLYGGEEQMLRRQRGRYAEALTAFARHYGAGREVSLYSNPGRTEIGGNHTDHNRGVVLAASVNLDIIAVAAPNGEDIIRVRSSGFESEDRVKLGEYDIRREEKGHSQALLRGVANGIFKRVGAVAGFDAYTTSDVLKGSGLSSSAAYEICLGNIINGEFCGGRFSPAELAMIGQYAENEYFGKPSGLMDQLACAVGGVITIDFKDPAAPLVEKVSIDLAAQGYAMVVTDTKGSHADLTPDYAAIPGEMRRVAALLGGEVLREVDEETFLAALPMLRREAGDRAVLRAIHFFEDSRRAEALAACLRKQDMAAFLALIVEGGHSSFEYNQNAYSPGAPQQQAVPVALALSQLMLAGKGAWRLQGGGFAGTIQAFVPLGLLPAYQARMEAVFGPGASQVLDIREKGCVKLRLE